MANPTGGGRGQGSTWLRRPTLEGLSNTFLAGLLTWGLTVHGAPSHQAFGRAVAVPRIEELLRFVPLTAAGPSRILTGFPFHPATRQGTRAIRCVTVD